MRARSRVIAVSTLALAVALVLSACSGSLIRTTTALTRAERRAIRLIPIPGPHASAITRATDSFQLLLLARNSPKCDSFSLVPDTVNGTPAQALLAVLAALRQPATPGDALPRALQNSVWDGGSNAPVGMYVRYIRLARQAYGVSYYIVPEKGWGSSLRPAACDEAMGNAIRAEIAKLPSSMRKRASAYANNFLAQQKASELPAAGDQVCLLFSGRRASGGTCGATAAVLRGDGLVSAYGPISGIVPDGVTSVTVVLEGAHGQRNGIQTVGVVDNTFVTTLGSPYRRVTVDPGVTWASGNTPIFGSPWSDPESVGGSSWCSGCRPREQSPEQSIAQTLKLISPGDHGRRTHTG